MVMNCEVVTFVIYRTGTVLSEFLQEIRKSSAQVNYSAMANILVVHSQSAGECFQITTVIISDTREIFQRFTNNLKVSLKSHDTEYGISLVLTGCSYETVLFYS